MSTFLAYVKLALLPLTNKQGGQGDETELVDKGKGWMIALVVIIITIIGLGIGLGLFTSARSTITGQIDKLKAFVDDLLKLE